MKKQQTLFFAAMLPFLMTVSAWTQEKPAADAAVDPVIAKMKPLLGDDTLAVIYVDFTKLDTTAILNNSRKSLEKTAADFGVPEDQLHDLVQSHAPTANNFDYEEIWKQSIPIAEMGKKTLTEICGVKEAFFVVRMGTMFPNLGYVAIPKTEKLNIEMIRQFLKMGQVDRAVLTRETDDYFFLVYSMFPHTITNNQNAKDALAAKIGAEQPAERSDFLEANNVVKDYPIRVLFAIPQYAKKVVAELKPELVAQMLQQFPALEAVNISQIVNGLKFQAIGFNPEQGKLLTVTETMTESDAQQIAKQADLIATVISGEFLKYLESLKKRSESVGDFLNNQEIMLQTLYPDAINEKSLAELKTLLIPKPDGKRFTVTCDAANAGTKFPNAGVAFVKILQANAATISESRKLSVCKNNFKQLILAMHNYYDSYGKLPPTFTVDKNGKPLQSWRVLLLPYLENMAIYESIRRNEAWDSEHNKQFHDKMPDVFRCPICTQGNPKSDTTYCMIVGEKALGRTDGTSQTFYKVTDGTSNTVCFTERQTPVCWMSPEDIAFDVAIKGVNQSPDGIGSEHDHCVNAGFLDGSVHVIKQNVPLDILEAVLTIAGGESKMLPPR
ncbi:MAG: DUF1559 domain-containing protein [Planctomycetaceae bacterium]|jgi:hypothetical protein|nr:DUF1559 domain-containing protein [Planctomycetaceae bacterium]